MPAGRVRSLGAVRCRQHVYRLHVSHASHEACVAPLILQEMHSAGRTSPGSRLLVRAPGVAAVHSASTRYPAHLLRMRLPLPCSPLLPSCPGSAVPSYIRPVLLPSPLVLHWQPPPHSLLPPTCPGRAVPLYTRPKARKTSSVGEAERGGSPGTLCRGRGGEEGLSRTDTGLDPVLDPVPDPVSDPAPDPVRTLAGLTPGWIQCRIKAAFRSPVHESRPHLGRTDTGTETILEM